MLSAAARTSNYSHTRRRMRGGAKRARTCGWRVLRLLVRVSHAGASRMTPRAFECAQNPNPARVYVCFSLLYLRADVRPIQCTFGDMTTLRWFLQATLVRNSHFLRRKGCTPFVRSVSHLHQRSRLRGNRRSDTTSFSSNSSNLPCSGLRECFQYDLRRLRGCISFLHSSPTSKQLRSCHSRHRSPRTDLWVRRTGTCQDCASDKKYSH